MPVISLARLQDINPVLCGTHACPPGHSYGPAVRRYYLLHYIFGGSGSFENERGAYSLQAGQMFVIRPGESTRYTASRDDPWRYAWIGFTCGFSAPVLQTGDVFASAGIGRLFREITGCAMENGRNWYLCGKVYELLSLLENTSPESNGPCHYVAKAINYMEYNYSTPLTIERIARLLGLDRSYFCRIFRQHTGVSPQKYLIAFRLDTAYTLLEKGEMLPTKAARSVGYMDDSNFSRMFKKRFGISPSKVPINRAVALKI